MVYPNHKNHMGSKGGGRSLAALAAPAVSSVSKVPSSTARQSCTRSGPSSWQHRLYKTEHAKTLILEHLSFTHLNFWIGKKPLQKDSKRMPVEVFWGRAQSGLVEVTNKIQIVSVSWGIFYAARSCLIIVFKCFTCVQHFLIPTHPKTTASSASSSWLGKKRLMRPKRSASFTSQTWESLKNPRKSTKITPKRSQKASRKTKKNHQKVLKKDQKIKNRQNKSKTQETKTTASASVMCCLTSASTAMTWYLGFFHPNLVVTAVLSIRFTRNTMFCFSTQLSHVCHITNKITI